MAYRGTVKNGVIVLDEPGALPEGVKVSVRPVKAKAGKGKTPTQSFYERYKRFAGAVKELPADSSVKLDRYLYNAQRQQCRSHP